MTSETAKGRGQQGWWKIGVQFGLGFSERVGLCCLGRHCGGEDTASYLRLDGALDSRSLQTFRFNCHSASVCPRKLYLAHPLQQVSDTENV